MSRRGFTLIELMVAGMMAAIVIGGITTALSQLGSAKAISRQRLEAFSRCDTAIRTLRRDIITTLRRGDLFDTRVLITDATSKFHGSNVDNDELLVFDGSLRANKEIDFNGEGMEYETQFRIEPNEVSAALWKRRDAILDDNPIGGGMATPIANGIIALQIEAFDGLAWLPQWDSDEQGIPHALRVTLTSTGIEFASEDMSAKVTLRTVVPLDRYQSPDDKLALIAEEEETERLAALGIIPGEEDVASLLGGDDPAGASGAGGAIGGGGPGGEAGSDTVSLSSSGSGSSGGSGGSGGGVTPTGGKQGLTITDPDGNTHDIPPSP
jgi:type II secretion system protein J